MKFSIKYIYIIFVFINSILALECYEEWFGKNIFKEYDYYIIDGFINENNPIKIHTNSKDTYRIDFLDKTIIGDSIKTLSFSKSTNQLYIDNIDYKLNDFIFSFFNIKNFVKKVKKTNKNYLKFKKTPYGQVEVFFNNNCSSIDSLTIRRLKNKFLIKNIMVKPVLKSIHIDSLFLLDVEDEKIFKYDLR